MNEPMIEVLCVPDEQIPQSWLERDNAAPGDIYLQGYGWREFHIPKQWQCPALLAALLEDAGAVKVNVSIDGRDDGRSKIVWVVPASVPPGTAWLLSIPEDTEPVDGSET